MRTLVQVLILIGTTYPAFHFPEREKNFCWSLLLLSSCLLPVSCSRVCSVMRASQLIFAVPSLTPLRPIPQIVDPLYVWRLALVVLLFLAAIGGGVAVLLVHFNEQVLAKPLRRFGAG